MDTNVTNADGETVLYKELSYKIVGLAMQVHNELGPGFLEKVYENALMVLFRQNGIRRVSTISRQCRISRAHRR